MKMWICPVLVDHGRTISVTVEQSVTSLSVEFGLGLGLGLGFGLGLGPGPSGFASFWSLTSNAKLSNT